MTTWVTVSQAAVMLGMSERNVRRHVAESKLESRLEGNRRLVKVESDDDKAGVAIMTMSDKNALVEWLKNELEERNRQINRLQEEMKLSREKSDKMMMKLTDELEAQRSIMKWQQSRQKRGGSFWGRWGDKHDADPK